jgi:hypothetical protein
MRLTDLQPQWLERDGRRIGFVFISPTKPLWRQSCFVDRVSHGEQRQIFESMFEAPHAVQGCNPDCAWTVAGGIEAASFDTMTVTPSLDGSAGGLWHGHITSGEIVGGI